MNKIAKIAIVVALLIVVGVVIAMKQKNNPPESDGSSKSIPAKETSAVVLTVEINQENTPSESDGSSISISAKETSLPRLVDLGSKSCIPCKMMAPILDELKKEYAGKFHVDFYDVRENPQYKEPYGVRIIPTQIFYDAKEQELWRHEGFMSKEDILSKWKELGVDLSGKAKQAK